MKVYMLVEEYINGFVYEEEAMDVTGTIENAEVWTKQKADAWVRDYKKDREWDKKADKLVRVDDHEEKGWETLYRRYVYRPRELWEPSPVPKQKVKDE